MQDYFQVPSCLWLKDCFELPNVFISTVLVQSMTSKEIVWVARDVQGEHTLMPYLFSRQDYGIFDRIVGDKQKGMSGNPHPKLFASVSFVQISNALILLVYI